MSKKNQREKVRKNGQIEQQDGEKDYKEILVEQYEKGLVPTITREQDFCFDCVQCGECCRNREDILLNPLDVFLPVSYTHLDVYKRQSTYSLRSSCSSSSGSLVLFLADRPYFLR